MIRHMPKSPLSRVQVSPRFIDGLLSEGSVCCGPIGILLDDGSWLRVHPKWRVLDVREAVQSSQRRAEFGAEEVTDPKALGPPSSSPLWVFVH